MNSSGLLLSGLIILSSILAHGEEPELNPNDDLVVPKNLESDEPISAENIGTKKEKIFDTGQPHIRLVPKYSGSDEPVLQKKTKKGEFLYRVPPSPQHSATSVHGGPFFPSFLIGDMPGITFQNIYGSKNIPYIQVEYEYQFLQSIGKLGLKGGFGFISTQGQARFKSNPTLAADETITFYSFPLSLSAVYRAQFAEKQFLVPYGEIGGDYFDFMEYRPDRKGTSAYRLGGAMATHAAGGIQLQLDFLDKEGLWQLDEEYGINHIYFMAAIHKIFGLSSTFDFSTTYYEGGFLIEF